MAYSYIILVMTEFQDATCSYSLGRHFRDNQPLNNVSGWIYIDFVMLCEFVFGPSSYVKKMWNY